jgi:hypothetical protein
MQRCGWSSQHPACSRCCVVLQMHLYYNMSSLVWKVGRGQGRGGGAAGRGGAATATGVAHKRQQKPCHGVSGSRCESGLKSFARVQQGLWGSGQDGCRSPWLACSMVGRLSWGLCMASWASGRALKAAASTALLHGATPHSHALTMSYCCYSWVPYPRERTWSSRMGPSSLLPWLGSCCCCPMAWCWRGRPFWLHTSQNTGEGQVSSSSHGGQPHGPHVAV